MTLKNKYMKIDFRKIKCTNIEGGVRELDISKTLGNKIYNETGDLGELDLAQRVYKHGEVELAEEDVKTVRKYLKQCFKAFIQKGFEETLKDREEANENRTE